MYSIICCVSVVQANYINYDSVILLRFYLIFKFFILLIIFLFFLFFHVYIFFFFFFFFFQAEDGIRDRNVTGVQTCALPIWSYAGVLKDDGLSYMAYVEQLTFLLFLKMADELTKKPYSRPNLIPKGKRSEERRVGKECRSRWSAEHEKKKRKKKSSRRGR